MLGSNGLFADGRRGQWLLVCGSSWMLLFLYGTLKFLWAHEWGYACVTGGVIAIGPLVVAITLWNRDRRDRAAAEAEAAQAAAVAEAEAFAATTEAYGLALARIGRRAPMHAPIQATQPSPTAE